MIPFVRCLLFAACCLLAVSSNLSAQTLAWNANPEPDIAGYRILYGTQPGTMAVTVDVGNVTSNLMTGLTAGATYYFRVVAYNTAGLVSASSPEVSYTVPIGGDTTAPGAPGTLTGSSPSTTQVSLAWGAASDNVGVTGYRVERCTGTNCTSFAQIATTTTAAYANTGLTASTTYRYRVRAVDAAGNAGPYSNIVTVTTTTGGADTSAPSAPGTPSATTPSSTQVTLSWAAATDNVGVSIYGIERCTGSSCSSFAQIGTSTTPSYADTGRTASTTYRYRVRAADAVMNVGPYSGIATVTTPSGSDTTGPSTPGSLTATVSSSTQITLAWSASTDNVGVTGYRAERCAGSNCTSFTQIATTTTPGYANTGLTASTTYRYRVRAVDGAGNLSGYSTVATATTSAGGSTCPCTIWTASTTPAVTSAPETWAVELGVKFRATTNGYITGVRFYKGAANTGTHVGTLWSAAGAMLATATFTNETATGWQQVNFAAPVAITANTTYVVSYNAPRGGYAYNVAFFGAAVTRGPLTALSNAAAGGNGVYRFGGRAFPNSTYDSANFWVDVVFTTTPPAGAASATTLMTSAIAPAAATSDASLDPATASDPVADASARETGVDDGDGLPAAWESQYGLDPASAAGLDGAEGDADGDGLSNASELARGSHPRGLFTRYLADGLVSADAGTWITVTNAGAAQAGVVLTLADEAGRARRLPFTLAAGAAREIDARSLLSGSARFSIAVEADQDVALERRMQWTTGAVTVAEGVASAAPTWYFAEGATSDPLDEFFVVHNPGEQPAEVQVRYLRPGGAAPLTGTYAVPAGGRATIWVDREDRLLADSQVAAEITGVGGVPIVAERSLFTRGRGAAPAAAESTVGLTSADARWTFDLAPLTTGVVIANPSAEAASVRLTLVSDGTRRDGGLHAVAAGGVVRVALPAVDVATPLSVEVESTTGTPVVVEPGAALRLSTVPRR